MSDPDLERMSKEQKDTRLQIENCKDPEKNKQLRKSRKEILKEMNQKVRDARGKRAEDLVGEVESAKDDTRMFKAANVLHVKHQKVQFVHDDQQRCVSQPQEIQKIIEQHFMKHFNKENINHIKKFITGAKRLKGKITAKEVKTAVWKMTNNKAPGKDNINVGLIKCAPEEIYKEIANILNGIYERNETGIKLGTGILLPLQKPKKTQGPVKKHRPITLLERIRKILSKIFMDRTEDRINKHLFQSQSAYRKSRSTTDVIWTHRWMAAKTQVQDIAIFITGIDMSSAFDTIYRDELKIVEEFLDEDDLQIVSTLLAETILEVKVENAQGTTFESNIGSRQGDSVSGPLFTLYFNRALQQIKDECRKNQ